MTLFAAFFHLWSLAVAFAAGEQHVCGGKWSSWLIFAVLLCLIGLAVEWVT